MLLAKYNYGARELVPFVYHHGQNPGDHITWVLTLQSRDCKQDYFCKLAITLPALPSFGSASSRILPLYHRRMGWHVVTRALHRSRPSNRYTSLSQFSQISQLRQNSKVDKLRTIDSLVEISCIFFLWPKQVYSKQWLLPLQLLSDRLLLPSFLLIAYVSDVWTIFTIIYAD
jgi:hypothetical protein